MLDYRIAGDRGILIYFGNVIDETVFKKLISFKQELEQNPILFIQEMIIGFCSIFISYDPLKIDFQELVHHLKKVENDSLKEKVTLHKKRIFEIPAVYGGAYGPDLAMVANIMNITESEVIQLHLANDYWVYINGGLGGSALFKGIGRLFDLPRRKTPVISYPAGTLLIAGGLGSVFKSLPGPTGFYGIGQSPLRQWYPDRNPPVLIKPGDWIRYRRIEEKEFHEIKRKIENGTYQLRSYE